MATMFEKLQLKGHTAMVVLNAPASFEPELSQLPALHIHRSLGDLAEIGFSLAFVTKQAELDTLTAKITAKAKGDAAVWFAYPKASSKKLKCEFNRDTGWDLLRQAGFSIVRSIAIDEDWTGLRFRRIQYVKSR